MDRESNGEDLQAVAKPLSTHWYSVLEFGRACRGRRVSGVYCKRLLRSRTVILYLRNICYNIEMALIVLMDSGIISLGSRIQLKVALFRAIQSKCNDEL